MIEGIAREVEDPLIPSDTNMIFISAGDFYMGSKNRDKDTERDEKPQAHCLC